MCPLHSEVLRKHPTACASALFLLMVFLALLMGYSWGGIFWVPSILLAVFILLGAVALRIYTSSSREAEPAEMADPTSSPVYYEETTPKEGKSKRPVILCPSCGYENPRDAEFCIRCGRDLDVTDDVARY